MSRLPPTRPAVLPALGLAVLLALPLPVRGADSAAPSRTSVSALLPPPPPPGSAPDMADRQIFATTRALRDSPRWRMATEDADLAFPAMLHDFSCAAGFTLDASVLPHVVAALAALQAVTKPAVKAQKEQYGRPRPFEGNTLPVCTPSKNLGYAYPSGHTVAGWTTALLLGRLMPEREDAFMQRARVFGESRVICGVHWASDVWAGYMDGSLLFERFENAPGQQALLAEARNELAEAARHAAPPDSARCALETDAARHSVLAGAP
ncbi:MAG: phosphatase PAP2 family protein [Acetobacter sp.]|uniref:acid phosphatase n=1 Tax=Acetobacter sp. TaxID=440 RepID=UPI003D043B2F